MMRHNISQSEYKFSGLTSRRLDSLNTTVDDLVQKAIQNEKILRRYQLFELELLDAVSLSSLLDMLIVSSVERFQLACTELWLFDPQLTLLQLLPVEYAAHPNIRFLKSTNELTHLYTDNPTVKLLSVNKGGSLPVFKGQSLHSAALLPLVRHGVIVGSLHFGVRGHQRFTKDKSTDFITHLASVVAVCLENAVSQDRLHRLSMYDMLTQVKNRRAFHIELDSEISRAARSGDPLSLLFVDIDYFKKVNDLYGHPTGDRVLKNVAQFINDLLRKTDHVCRYGGEEFSLILPNCTRQRAFDIAERIRQQVSELQSVDDSGNCVKVTLSIGISGWYQFESSRSIDRQQEKIMAAKLISCSDKGVYYAKSSGRNCTKYIEI